MEVQYVWGINPNHGEQEVHHANPFYGLYSHIMLWLHVMHVARVHRAKVSVVYHLL